MTKAQILAWLSRHERDVRNELRKRPERFDQGYCLGRAHACAELTLAIQRSPRKRKTRAEA